MTMRIESNCHGFGFSLDTKYASAEAIGTLIAVAGESYAFSCDFGAAVFATLHIDDHLVCQKGANDNSAGVDTPLPVRTRTQLAVRLVVLFDRTSAQIANKADIVRVNVTTAHGSPVVFSPSLSKVEGRRRTVQNALLQGWGQFNAMSYSVAEWIDG